MDDAAAFFSIFIFLILLLGVCLEAKWKCNRLKWPKEAWSYVGHLGD